jgi:hypothetical protein
MLKNTIQAILAEDGVTVSSTDRSRLFKGTESVSYILCDHPGITPLTASALLADVGDD